MKIKNAISSASIAIAILALAAAPLRASAAPAPGGRFHLVETQSGAAVGPFTLYNGARIRVKGVIYRVTLSEGEGRVTFTSEADSKSYGPYQPVAGRIMRIGGTTYSYSAGTPAPAAPAAPVVRPPANNAPIAEFAPLPPKPEMIEVPDEPRRSTVKPLSLPALPDASRPFSWNVWYAPLDVTEIKWKIEKVEGNEVEYKRQTVGAGLSWNSWTAEAALSPSGKSSSIVPDGLGLSGTSIDGSGGWSLGAGYKRPFLREGGWTASAGVFGRIRQDKGDISSMSLVTTGDSDTNELGNVISKFENRKETVKLTEAILRLDFELAYRSGSFGGFAGVKLQPFSSLDISGKLPNGDEELKLTAEHNDAIGFTAGGLYEFANGLRAFADFEVGIEKRLRIGLSRDF